jgi:hypothetical protein
MIPKHKDDIGALEILKDCSPEYIINNSADLLIWLQDINWPIARKMAKILRNYTNEIELEIVKILKSNDGLWKYSVILCVIYQTEILTSAKIINEIKRIISFPTESDIGNDLVEYCIDVLNEFNIPLPPLPPESLRV